MKTLLTSLIVGVVLSGCASAPVSPWKGLTVDTEPVAEAVDCGRFPAPYAASDEEISYDRAGVNALQQYRLCADANAEIADEHAATIGELKVTRKALVEAGQSQYNIAAMRQQMLRDERRHHLFTSIGYWVLIVGLAL